MQFEQLTKDQQKFVQQFKDIIQSLVFPNLKNVLFYEKSLQDSCPIRIFPIALQQLTAFNYANSIWLPNFMYDNVLQFLILNKINEPGKDFFQNTYKFINDKNYFIDLPKERYYFSSYNPKMFTSLI